MIQNESTEKIEERFFSVLEKYELLQELENVMCFFSGGKDATFGLYLLKKYADAHGLKIQFKAFMLLYPKHMYFDENGRERESFIQSVEFCKNIGVDLTTLHTNSDDLKENEPGCHQCKNVRLELIHQIAKDYLSKTAIMTGYTLYDIMAYIDRIAIATGYTFDLKRLEDEKLVRTVNAYLHKMQIKEKLPNGVTFIRPLLPFSDEVIRDYLERKKIKYMREQCLVSSLNYKRVYFNNLNLMKEFNPTRYEDLIAFLLKNGIELPTTYSDLESDIYFRDC